MDQSERSINWGDYTSPKASERSFLATIARFLVAGSHSCSCVLSGILQEIRCEFDHYALISDAACRHTTYLGHLITWEEHMLALANESDSSTIGHLFASFASEETHHVVFGLVVPK